MPKRANVVSRVAELAGDVLRMAQTRLEMLSVEIQRERDAIVLQLKLGMTSVIAAGIAGVSAVLWAALALAPQPRAIALGLLTLLFVAISVGAMLVARRERRRQSALFGSVIAQLARDRSTLSAATNISDQEPLNEPTRDSRESA